MNQLRSFADDRLVNGCIYCGGAADTRDHSPSRVFLDPPFPENLPVVGACCSCNNGFSQDEEYFACLIESAVAGSTDPDHIRRERVAKILRQSPALRARIEDSKVKKEGQTIFGVEIERVKNVLLKLARGHAAFELNQSCRNSPTSIFCAPMATLTQEQQDDFDAAHVLGLFGEVGSRNLQRAMVVEASLRSESGDEKSLRLLVNDWIDVQEGRYRYLAIDDEQGVIVRIVIAEYLACEIWWNSEGVLEQVPPG